MAQESGGTVLLALGVNAAVALAKIVAGVLGGSVVMLAEAGHSLADTLNEFFLWLSLKRSKREPDRQHPFGYGKERFFWALIAAVGIFIAGAGFSLFEAFKAFSESPKSANKGYLIDYAVFGFAAIVEFVSWVRAYRQTKREATERGRSFSQHIKLSPDPSVKTVASEDTVAILGDLLGIAATAIQQITGQPLWDGVAALVIMAMLIFVAFALARDNKDLLIGEAIEKRKEEELSELVRNEPGVDEIFDMLTMRVGTESVLVAARVGISQDLDGAAVEKLSEKIDRDIREALPDVSEVFIDPSRRRGEDDSHGHRDGSSSDGASHSAVRTTTLVTQPGSELVHRPECPRIGGAVDLLRVSLFDVRLRGLKPCPSCKP